MKTVRCILKKGKERAPQGYHPWIFSGAIDRIEDSARAGDLVRVLSHDEKFLGLGYFNPQSQISVRLLSFEDVAIDESFFGQRIREAADLRRRLIESQTNAYRVIHSEGDFLPGLLVDRYGDYLAVQFLTAGMEQRKGLLTGLLQEELAPKGIFEKDDSEVRVLEGLKPSVQILAGEEPPELVEIEENGMKFLVDLRGGQKTGFYLDQRENRKIIGTLSRGKKVLNCFCYSGGFSVSAALGGASHTVSVDSSAPALELAGLNFKKNGLDSPAHQCVKEDVFEYLRRCADKFDLIVLDPPAFCKNKKQVKPAARGYKDINLQALKLLSPGGLLLTCSCSSFITQDLFQKIVFGAAKDSGRRLRILAKTAHAFDHPVNIYHPEGEYLKGLLCQIDF